MKIEQTTSNTIDEIWADLEPRIGKSKCLAEAAQELAAALHTRFDESIVISRVFLTVPFGKLPPTETAFVKNLAESAGAASGLKPTTPVLSLMGTHGQEENWRDRRNSKGHLGIPLISSAFVGAIPMISRLLGELGVPMEWVDSHDSEIIEKIAGRQEGLFFVDDAGQAVDHQGRKIIAAQDFVSAYKVKSVFGMGEVYAGGQMLVVVVFCRDSLAKTTAESYLKLSDQFGKKTASFVSSAKIFPGS